MEKLTRRACRSRLGIGTGSRHSACLWGHHKYCEASRSPAPAGRTRCFARLSMTGWRGISISYTGHSTPVDYYLAGVEARHDFDQHAVVHPQARQPPLDSLSRADPDLRCPFFVAHRTDGHDQGVVPVFQLNMDIDPQADSQRGTRSASVIVRQDTSELKKTGENRLYLYDFPKRVLHFGNTPDLNRKLRER